MEHIYDQLQFGEDWFFYSQFYSKMVRKFPSGSHFVEIGSWKGKSSAYMAVEIANSNKDIKFEIHSANGKLKSLWNSYINVYERHLHRYDTMEYIK